MSLLLSFRLHDLLHPLGHGAVLGPPEPEIQAVTRQLPHLLIAAVVANADHRILRHLKISKHLGDHWSFGGLMMSLPLDPLDILGSLGSLGFRRIQQDCD